MKLRNFISKHSRPFLVLLFLGVLTGYDLYAQNRSWEIVGSPNISSGMSSADSDMVIDRSGAPIVFYDGPSGLAVKRFNGADWELLGTDGFAANGLSDARLSIALDDEDNPHVAFVDNSNMVRVMQFDGSAWADVGGLPSLESDQSPDLAFRFNEPHVLVNASDTLFLYGYNGLDWFSVGDDGVIGIPGGELSLGFTSFGDPVVAFKDLISNGANVMMATFVDFWEWDLVGPANFYPSVNSLSMDVGENDVPNVAFQNTNQRASVMYFDGLDWVFEGGAEDISTDLIENISIEESGNSLYVAYQVAGGGMTVMETVSGIFEFVGDEQFTPGQAEFSGIDVFYDEIFVGFNDLANSSGVSVMNYNCDDHLIRVVIELDSFPEETSWGILDDNGAVVTFDGPYDGMPLATVTIPVCLADGCYDFIVGDNSGNGICCDSGEGRYYVLGPNGDTLVMGGEFEDLDTMQFCLPTGPFALIDASDTELSCTTGPISLDGSGSVGDSLSYEWQDDAGMVLGTDAVLIVSEPGMYQLKVTEVLSGSFDVATIEITGDVLMYVISNFLVAATACTGDTIQFIDYSIIDSTALTTATFFWEFGNGDTSTGRDPLYTYADPGSYDIRLEVSTDDCPMVEVSKTIDIFSCLSEGELGITSAGLNPTLNRGQFEVLADLASPGDLTMHIYNFNGALVSSETFANVFQLKKPVTLAEDGIYYIQLIHKYGVKTLRTIVIN